MADDTNLFVANITTEDVYLKDNYESLKYL